MKTPFFMMAGMLMVMLSWGQTKEAFDKGDMGTSSSSIKGLLDPSRFSVSHSMSFGMSSGTGSSSLQSQSFYSTMMQYKFAAPLTLNLNFSMPIHSSYSPHQNLTSGNLQSFDYFRNMPFDVSLSWKPSERFQLNFAIVNYPAYSPYGYRGYEYGYMPWRTPFIDR
ncbi:MAG: hypothetical protein JW768_15835 [Chitinispirillaceae bacterium]|nr:hypothetical protein [Chitinispirillaceae bacterium]